MSIADKIIGVSQLLGTRVRAFPKVYTCGFFNSAGQLIEGNGQLHSLSTGDKNNACWSCCHQFHEICNTKYW